MINRETILKKEPTIHENSKLTNVGFESYNEIGDFNFIENANFGQFSYTGEFCYVQNAEIGRFVNIAACVRIGPTDHPITRPTLHHFTYRPGKYGFFDGKNEKEFFDKRESRTCYIGNDVWIGHGAIIMPEVKIGDGAIIGAGAIVTKDILPYAIAVGNPARTIKYRFDEETILKLQKIKWWDWDYETIKERFCDFKKPVDEFIDMYWEEKNV